MKEWAMEEIVRDIESGQIERAAREALALPAIELGELIVRTGRMKSPNAAAFLTLLYAEEADKRLQKLIKKSLFILRTLGVPAPEPRASGESVLMRAEVVRETRALLSNYDAGQTRAVLVAVQRKKNEFLFVHGATSFSRGLEELRSFEVSREELEEIVREYTSKTRRPMVLTPISACYAAFLLEEASAASGRHGDDVRTLAHLVASSKEEVERPADVYLLEGRGSSAPASLDAVLDSDILSPFALDWKDMEEDRKRLKDVTNPAIVIPPHLIQERTESFLEELLGREDVKSRLSAFKRMLEDTAYLFYSLGEKPNYEALVDLLKNEEGVLKAFLFFLRKALQKKDELEQEPGVIIDPRSLVSR